MNKNLITSGVKKLLTAFLNSNVAQVVRFGKPSPTMVLYPYGSLGNAPIDSQMITFTINGNEDNKVSIEFSLTDKPEFVPKDGEYICGNFKNGNVVYFKEDGTTLITGNVVLGDDGVAAAIARVGDTVNVGGVDGTITSGSTNHTAT